MNFSISKFIFFVFVPSLFLLGSCTNSKPPADKVHARTISFLNEQYLKSVNRLKHRAEEQPGFQYLRASNRLDTLIRYYLSDLDKMKEKKDLSLSEIMERNKKFYSDANDAIYSTRFLRQDSISIRFEADSAMLFPAGDPSEFIFQSREFCLQKSIAATDMLENAIGTSSDWFITVYDIGFRFQVYQKTDTLDIELNFTDPKEKQYFKKVEYNGISDSLEKKLNPVIFKDASDNSAVRLKIKPLRAGKYFLNYTTFFIRGDGSVYDRQYKREFIVY